jgi:hypothetical protein
MLNGPLTIDVIVTSSEATSYTKRGRLAEQLCPIRAMGAIAGFTCENDV